MNRKRWKTRVLTKLECEALLRSPDWTLHQRASEARGAPVYAGPDGQLILLGHAKVDRPRLLLTGGQAYLEMLFLPSRAIPIVGAFYLKPETFLKLLPIDAKVTVAPDPDPDHTMAGFPPSLIQPNGEGFVALLVRIGSRITELDPSFHWRVLTADGIMTRIDLQSENEAIALDARACKQIWDRQTKRQIKNIDVEHYARHYLRFREKQRRFVQLWLQGDVEGDIADTFFVLARDLGSKITEKFATISLERADLWSFTATILRPEAMYQGWVEYDEKSRSYGSFIGIDYAQFRRGDQSSRVDLIAAALLKALGMMQPPPGDQETMQRLRDSIAISAEEVKAGFSQMH